MSRHPRSSISTKGFTCLTAVREVVVRRGRVVPRVGRRFRPVEIGAEDRPGVDGAGRGAGAGVPQVTLPGVVDTVDPAQPVEREGIVRDGGEVRRAEAAPGGRRRHPEVGRGEEGSRAVGRIGTSGTGDRMVAGGERTETAVVTGSYDPVPAEGPMRGVSRQLVIGETETTGVERR